MGPVPGLPQHRDHVADDRQQEHGRHQGLPQGVHPQDDRQRPGVAHECHQPPGQRRGTMTCDEQCHAGPFGQSFRSTLYGGKCAPPVQAPPRRGTRIDLRSLRPAAQAGERLPEMRCGPQGALRRRPTALDDQRAVAQEHAGVQGVAQLGPRGYSGEAALLRERRRQPKRGPGPAFRVKAAEDGRYPFMTVAGQGQDEQIPFCRSDAQRPDQPVNGLEIALRQADNPAIGRRGARIGGQRPQEPRGLFVADGLQGPAQPARPSPRAQRRSGAGLPAHRPAAASSPAQT